MSVKVKCRVFRSVSGGKCVWWEHSEQNQVSAPNDIDEIVTREVMRFIQTVGPENIVSVAHEWHEEAASGCERYAFVYYKVNNS